MDRPAPAGARHVLRLYFHGYPFAHQGPDGVYPRVGLQGLRHDAGFRNLPQRLRFLPDLRRHYPGQDGRALHRRPFRCRHAGGRYHQILCGQRILLRIGIGNMVHQQPELAYRHPFHRRCPAILPGDAGIGENGGRRFHDLRLRRGNGRHYGQPWYRKVVQRP